MKHYSVLLSEAISGLNIKPNGIYVDATLGYGGHSAEILKRIKKGFLFAFDQDEDAIIYSKARLIKISDNFKIIYANFAQLEECLAKEKIKHVDGIIFDLGLSSPQIDEINRGFSFMRDAPLDMRMDKLNKITAASVVENYSESELTEIFFNYGEEKFSKSIAKNIVKVRAVKPITTTLELVAAIKGATPLKYFLTNHPERQIFQAIRIEVNKELKVLETALEAAIKLLNKNGRLAVITFHSLEDRIVKQIFKKYSEINPLVKGLPEIPEAYQPLIKLINRKPLVPSALELQENRRSKSAKLRIVERI